MSIIYEALKKVEGQKEILTPESIPQGVSPSVERVERVEKKTNREKKMAFLPAILLLIALGIAALPFILPDQEPVQDQKVVAPVVERGEIDPARVYKVLESRSQVLGEVTLRAEPVVEYILEGFVYDPEAPFALINGRVINESDILGNFQIDRITEDRVGMTNIKDSSKVTLSLSD